MNLRYYYPDFVAVDTQGTYLLLETKGQETSEVPRKDAAAALWCENATQLTGMNWKYQKITQELFESLHPKNLANLALFFTAKKGI